MFSISATYSVDALLRELEGVLKIDGQDYDEVNFNNIMQNIRTRIVREYQIDMEEGRITESTLERESNRELVEAFVSNVARAHGKFCGYVQICRYEVKVPTDLERVNWYGFTKDSIQTMLRKATSKRGLPACEGGFSGIKERMGSIVNCLEKRVTMVMLVAYELGFDELSSAIAEMLYCGGL
jgi:hypothetical protein